MARPPPHLERFLAGHGLPSQVPQGQGDRLRPCPTLSRSMIAWTWTSSISMGCGSSGVTCSCQCVTVLLPYVVEDAAWPGSSSPPPPARTAPGTDQTPLPRPSCCCAYPWHRSFPTFWSQHPRTWRGGALQTIKSGTKPQVTHGAGLTPEEPHQIQPVQHAHRPPRPPGNATGTGHRMAYDQLPRPHETARTAKIPRYPAACRWLRDLREPRRALKWALRC